MLFFSLMSFILLVILIDTSGKIVRHFLKIEDDLNYTLGFISILAIYFIVSTIAILLSFTMLTVFILYTIINFLILLTGFKLRDSIAFLKPIFKPRQLIITFFVYLIILIFDPIEIPGYEMFDITFYYPLITSNFDANLMNVPFGRIIPEIPIIVDDLKSIVLYTYQSYYGLLAYFQKISMLPSVAYIHYIFSFVFIYMLCEMLFIFSENFKKKYLVNALIFLSLLYLMYQPTALMLFFLGSQHLIFIFALCFYALIKLKRTSFTVGLIWGLAFFNTVSSAVFIMPLVLISLYIVMFLENDDSHVNFSLGILFATFISMTLMVAVIPLPKVFIVLTLLSIVFAILIKSINRIKVTRNISNVIYLILAVITLYLRVQASTRSLMKFDAIVWFALFVWLFFYKKNTSLLLKLFFVHSFLIGNEHILHAIVSTNYSIDVISRTLYFSMGMATVPYRILMTYIVLAESFKDSYRKFLIAGLYIIIMISELNPDAIRMPSELNKITDPNVDIIYLQDKMRVDIIKQLDDYDSSIDKRISAPFRVRLISIDNQIVFTRHWSLLNHRFIYEDLYILDEPLNPDQAFDYLKDNTDYFIIQNERIILLENLENFKIIVSNDSYTVFEIK